jgi:hypothetical protein
MAQVWAFRNQIQWQVPVREHRTHKKALGLQELTKMSQMVLALQGSPQMLALAQARVIQIRNLQQLNRTCDASVNQESPVGDTVIINKITKRSEMAVVQNSCSTTEQARQSLVRDRMACVARALRCVLVRFTLSAAPVYFANAIAI